MVGTAVSARAGSLIRARRRLPSCSARRYSHRPWPRQSTRSSGRRCFHLRSCRPDGRLSALAYGAGAAQRNATLITNRCHPVPGQWDPVRCHPAGHRVGIRSFFVKLLQREIGTSHTSARQNEHGVTVAARTINSAGPPPMTAAGAPGGADDTAVAALLETPLAGDLLFRHALEHAPVGIAFANRDGSYRHCNRAFCAMLGYELAELTARSVTGITAMDDIAATAEGLARLWRGEIPHLDIEKRYLRKDGSTLWVRVSTSLVSGGSAPECTVEFLRDISARKLIGAELLQNQTLLATMIAELPLGLLACDVEGRITHYNRTAVELFGISTEDTGAAPADYPISAEVMRADGKTAVPRAQRPLARALRG